MRADLGIANIDRIGKEAKIKLFVYVEVFYNRRRRYSTLDDVSPSKIRARGSDSLDLAADWVTRGSS